MNQKMVIVLAAILAFALLSGCAGSTPTAPSSSSIAPPAGQEANSDQPISSAPSENTPTPSETPDISSSSGEPFQSAPEGEAGNSSQAIVYMSTDISPEGLAAVYGWQPAGKVAVKLSTGEPGGEHYLQPTLIKKLVQRVEGTIVECNTAYGGGRANTAAHMQAAKDHGFTEIAEVDIMDADGDISLPVTGGSQMKENLVGAHLENYDSMLVLSHFKGHAMGGFGGAVKNISIGIASSRGKVLIHSGGVSSTSWGNDHDGFLRGMAEAAKSVSDRFGEGKQMAYISVMNNLSVDCDCDSSPAAPDMHDIGILASTDPVALDQACVDLVYSAPDGASLIERIESRNGLLTLEHAGEIGLGSREYQLVSLDD